MFLVLPLLIFNKEKLGKMLKTCIDYSRIGEVRPLLVRGLKKYPIKLFIVRDSQRLLKNRIKRFDYIHTTASMVSQFAKNNLGEHTILMMMANQLKQIAKDNNICIFSSTQVNATAMTDDMEFKNETCIRGSKSVADKVDIGYVMSKIGVKTWNSMKKILQPAAISGKIDRKYILDDNYKPTHILDIYKMRRGRFKNVRIWCHLDLGTGRRQDLFMTTSDNQVIDLDITGYNKVGIIRVNNWKDAVQ